ncbi:MAG: NADH-quinone oxidoreductase subunit M [Planctomycetota bacterium]|nr:MAG: NADH-quinone oxidoreductase subunit M [Planctomycetota bacterium]
MIGFLIALMSLPLATAVLLMLFRASAGQNTARWMALLGTVVTLCVSVVAVAKYKEQLVGNASQPVQPRIVWRHTWLEFETEMVATDVALPDRVKLEFFLGADGVSLALIALTSLLSVSAVLISWESIKERAAEFYICLLVLQAGLIGVFCAFDLLLFYVFFEFTLIPLFFMVGLWGGAQRHYAAMKFFLYTLVGSLITLIGLAALVLTAIKAGVVTPFSIPDLSAWFADHPMGSRLQTILFLTLSAGFMVKVPLFPFHTWLPLAHVEAPTAGSVMLAGVLLKLGSYGFFRISLPIFRDACEQVGTPLIATLSVIGIVYGSFCALAQRDIKKLVAYSSVAHLGFCMLGLFALNAEGVTGSLLQMINHGLSTGALFLLVGMIYDRYHTRQLDDLGGLAKRLPMISVAMVFTTMASIGLPGLNGFVGEMLSLAGMFKLAPIYAVIGTSGVVLGAWYMLTMVQHGFFGPLKEPHDVHGPVSDMSPREACAFLPLAVMCLWIGVMPQSFIELMRPDIEAVTNLYHPPRILTSGPSLGNATHNSFVESQVQLERE